MFNEPRPFVFRGNRHLRISISGQVYKIELVVYTIEVDRLRPAGRITGERQPSFTRFPCNRIEKAGFSDIAPPQKSYLGQPVGGELLGTTGANGEFRYQVYYTQKMDGIKGVFGRARTA